MAAFIAPSAGAQSVVNHDINSYVLYATATLDFKGANAVGRGFIDGGNVGADGIGVDPNTVHLNICANGRVTMRDGTQVTAPRMRIEQTCDVWDVFANELTVGSDVVPRNEGPTSFTPPVVASLPPFPDFSCNDANPVTVDKNGSATLGPGVYGLFDFKDGATVTLAPGIYDVCDFKMGQAVTVITQPGVVVRSTKRFPMSNDTVFGPSECTEGGLPLVFARSDGVGANDNTVKFAKDTTVSGHFYAPNGKIALGNGTNLEGTFWGNRIISDFDVNIDFCPPTTVTTTTSSSTTSSLTTTTTVPSTVTTGGTTTSTASTTTTVPESSTSSESTVTTRQSRVAALGRLVPDHGRAAARGTPAVTRVMRTVSVIPARMLSSR